MDEEQQLTKEQIVVYHAYLTVFSTSFGQIVLNDLRKSWFDKPFGDLTDHSWLVQRATLHDAYLKITRIMSRAAEHIERSEGVEPTKTPEVVPGEDFTTE